MMNRNHRKFLIPLWLIIGSLFASASAQEANKSKPEPLVIQEQGSFAVGGKIITNSGIFNPKQPTPDGQTLHGDHAYVFYEIPVNRRKLPLVFLHGTGQFSKTWETTPDGREGFQTIFLRRRFPVYLIDQPRRGNAGKGTVSATINATPDEQMWFDTFRVGIWPDYFPGVQFSKDPEALDQYFRQMTSNVGPYDPAVISDACAALFNKIGPAVFVTHSQGGGLGWATVLKDRQCARDRSVRARQWFPLSRERSSRDAAKFRWGARGDRRAHGRVHETYQDSHHHFLRRLHPREAQRKSRPGWMADSAGNGQKVAGYS